MADAHLERIEQKIDAVADHVKATDLRTSAIDRRLEQVDRRLEQLEGKVTAGFVRLEQKIDSMAETQRHINRELSDTVQDHEHRIVVLENKPTLSPKP